MLNIIYTENALENIDQIVFNITEFVGVYSAIDMIDDIKKSKKVDEAGAIFTFEGIVRGKEPGKEVDKLKHENKQLKIQIFKL